MRTPKLLDGFLPLALLLAVMFALAPAPTCIAQDADAPALTAPSEDTSEATEAAAEPAEEPAAGEEASSEEPSTEPAADAPVTAPAEEPAATPSDSADGDEGAEAAPKGFDWPLALAILAVLIVPGLVGNWFASRLKMPDHGWKIGVVLTSLAIAGLCLATGEFKFGTDLAGGTTLIYEVKDKDRIADDNADTSSPTDDAKPRVKLEQVIAALKMRIDPAGTKEVSIRKYGEDIEVIVPKASQSELEYIKRKLTDLGELEFRITASPVWPQDRGIIDQARTLRPSQKVVILNNQPSGRWVPGDSDEFEPDQPGFVTRQVGETTEVLVLLDALDITGKYLTSASSYFDNQTGRPAVNFTFNDAGSARFGKLTGDNLPNRTTNQRRNLGIMLDGKLLSAPYINDRITNQGQISGESMTKEEVDHIVSVLEAGSLPAALNEDPISQETISPTLGPITIEKGKVAISISLVAVLIFILLYYRFAGLMACLALVANLALVLGLMVLLGAAFTLPGLAGLVLTVGMSVDANVLIFERIREELKRGAALRMAIRNGFDRATTTIVDANVTTLITGVVLYTIGTDTIKGFAVTLILGILMSMFTAIFCSRIVFEIAERKRWVKSLSFSSIVGDTNINFISKYAAAITLSLVIIATGLVGVFGRGAGILNIDFTGGSSVTQVLANADDLSIKEIRNALEETDLADKNLLVSERGENSGRYTISTSMQDVDAVKAILKEQFGDKLLNNSLTFGEPTAYSEDDVEGSSVELTFNEGDAYGAEDGFTHDALTEQVAGILDAQGIKVKPILENPDYVAESNQRFKQWTLLLGGVQPDAARQVAEALRAELTQEPIFPLANKIGGKVAGNLQTTAIQAILVSLLGIVGYLWFRFQNVAFGLAAVVALVHDVLVTLGFVAISAYVVDAMPGVASALQLDPFQISLTMIAAFLTIIGYSLNDTIVIFDRVREVRGKSPKITAEMVNTSINQTLARTLLTSITTLIVVVILYFFGGPGIHDFAFALSVGVIAGTYSTIFIACPALLTFVGAKGASGAKAGRDSAADAA